METRFDRWASTYDQSFLQKRMFGPAHQAVLDLYASLNRQPTDVLDIGCGTGRLLDLAAGRWPEARLTGVDCSQAMADQAAAKHANSGRFTFKQADAAALPFDTASFDAAFSTISFHHWADQASGLREVARALKPGGAFVLADMDVPFGFLLGPVMKWMDGSQVRGLKELRGMLEQAGFKVQASRRIWPMSRAQVHLGIK